MNRIELAARRYRDLVTEELVATAPAERYWRMPMAPIKAWINDYVLPAVEEVFPRPVFRGHATWPQRTLIAGAETPERAIVERVDRALVAEARALSAVARNPAVAEGLQALATAAPSPPKQEVVDMVSTNSPPSVAARANLHTHIPNYVAHLETMAGRPWTDLVCGDDYLGPVGGMMRKEPLPPGVTEGAMVVSLSAHLYYVGDSITRCLMQRVRSWISFLSEAREVCYDAVRHVGQVSTTEVTAEQSTWTELQTDVADLQLCCLAGAEAHLREACIALVQVYAEFHLAPDLGWLGVRREALERFRGMLAHSILSRRDLETVERIAGALGELRLLYRELRPEVSTIDEAVGSGGLVLVEHDRRAYWQGELIQRDWNNRRCRNHWQMLWRLAINARAASAVGNFDLYRTAVANSTIHSRALRLKNLLPTSLRELIQPGAEQATYRLTLPLTRIHLFPSDQRAATARRADRP